jgi:hypothetical protein
MTRGLQLLRFLRFAMLRLIAGIVLLTALSATAGTYTDKATKLRFPDKLGSWEKGEVHHFDEPGAGISIHYRHPLTGIATFYIYDNGLKEIPTGGKSGAVVQEFATVLQQIETTYSGPKYEHLKKIMDAAPEVRSNGKTATLLASVYSFSVRDEHPPQRLSYALLTGYRNRFLKLRFTLPADFETNPERGQTELKQLVTALLEANRQHAASFWDASVAPPADKEETTADAALRAIQEFQADPLAAFQRGVPKTIVSFAKASPAVLVRFSDKVVPWITKGEMDDRKSILLTAFVAGNTESQLRRGKKEDDPVAGVLQAIATYRQLQQADPAYLLDELEALIVLEKEGRLKEHLSAK